MIRGNDITIKFEYKTNAKRSAWIQISIEFR